MRRAPRPRSAPEERPIDPRMIELVRALAREAARRDHRLALERMAARRAGEAKE